MTDRVTLELHRAGVLVRSIVVTPPQADEIEAALGKMLPPSDYPKCLYRPEGLARVVENETEEGAALADGWALTIEAGEG